MERYLLKYLMDSTQDEWKKRYYDYMRMAIDRHLWSYGNNFNSSLERWIYHKNNYVIPKHGIGRYILSMFERYTQNHIRHNISNTEETNTQRDQYEYNLLAIYQKPYLPDETILALKEFGIGVEFAFDGGKLWSEAMSNLSAWYGRMRFLPFNEIIKDYHVEELKKIYADLLSAIQKSNLDALIVFTAEPFEAKVLIDIFRELGRFSMELLHGLPEDNPIQEDRVDYILAYGNSVRNVYLDAGIKSDKVLVAGNGKYVNAPQTANHKLRCSLEDVLVMTSITAKEHEQKWHYEEFGNNDRSLLITYLYSIESVLKRNGVSKARLRSHPTINKEWLLQFIDMDFYEMDYLSLSESFAKATCCIGQNSTTVLEAIQSGLSYIVYEPGDGVYSLLGEKLIPLFRENPYLKLAKSEEELDEMIKARYCANIKLLDECMTVFKPEVIKQILDKHCKK